MTKELFINRELESFPVWTHQRGGKRHVYAASFTTDSICGTAKRSATKEFNTDDELRNVTCKLCRAKVVADLHGLLATIFRGMDTGDGEAIDAALFIECEAVSEQFPWMRTVTILQRLAVLSEETRKWIAEQERLKRAAYHARRGRMSLIIHETIT